jgi:diguanylate cyclase
VRWSSCGLNRRRWSGVALVVVVALLGCATTGFATRNARSAEQRYTAQLMDRYTSDLGRAITTQIQRYGETLVDVAIALGAQSELAAGDFTWITNKISNRHLPGATSLRYVVSTPETGTAALQSYWRSRGASTLTLQPAAVTDEEHAFAVFTRSFNGEPVVAGTDLSADPEAADTLREAYSAGGLAVSRAYVLPKDKELPAE